MDFPQHFFAVLRREQISRRLEKIVVITAVVSFLLHVLLIAARNFYPEVGFLQGISRNYLSALFTPFNVILVYEVYLMILALPMSFNLSIRKQYEVISLITIRNVFKDIALFDDFTHLTTQTEQLAKISIDLGGGLLLFFLVGVFHHVSLYRIRPKSSEDLATFVKVKQIVAILLLTIFVVLSLYSLYDWSKEIVDYLVKGDPMQIDAHLIFFEDFYTIMIFADVLIFIASFIYSQRYATLLRNAGFVASAIFLRMSLAGESYYGVALAAFAILTGILAQLIHNYYFKLDQLEIEPIKAPEK